jgi:hypothetical protein
MWYAHTTSGINRTASVVRVSASGTPLTLCLRIPTETCGIGRNIAIALTTTSIAVYVGCSMRCMRRRNDI